MCVLCVFATVFNPSPLFILGDKQLDLFIFIGQTFIDMSISSIIFLLNLPFTFLALLRLLQVSYFIMPETS